MAGRPPVPTRLKVLRGTDQACRTNQDEPKPAADRIRAPANMPAEARKYWKPMLRMLQDAKIVTNADVQALEALCIVYARWREANAQLEKTGLLVKTPNGYPAQSPYLAIANKAFDQMKAMLTEFGMTPSSRTRVRTTESDGGGGAGDWGGL